jgi:hypothetical protein
MSPSNAGFECKADRSLCCEVREFTGCSQRVLVAALVTAPQLPFQSAFNITFG